LDRDRLRSLSNVGCVYTTGNGTPEKEEFMDIIISAAKAELESARSVPPGNRLKTGDIRKISAKIYKNVKGKPVDDVLSVCGELLEQRNRPMGIMAYDFAYRVRKQYNDKTFAVFESWLENYVRGWGDCDDFCIHAFGELICQNTKLAENVIAWTKKEGFWMRRAAAVVLIPSIWHNQYKETHPLRVSDILMADGHYLVLKGYGWMLKVLSTKEPELVMEYLLKNKAVMPRVAYRYALEKMDAAVKRVLMQ